MKLEIAIAGVHNRNQIIDYSELKSWLSKARQLETDFYRSVYMFDDLMLEHMQIRKTVKNFKGNFYLDYLFFDIDKGKNSDEFTLQRARVFYQELLDDWKLSEEHIRIWFSGRGYHFTTPDIFGFTPSNYMHLEVKATIEKYFPQVDPKIYVSTGLFRVGYSLNLKSKLYKIPLTFTELNTLNPSDIFELASIKNFRKLAAEDKSTIYIVPDKHVEMIIKDKVKAEEEANKPKDDYNSRVTCMQKLYDEEAVEGMRHESIMRMVSSFKRGGMPRKAILASMIAWAPSMNPVEIKKIVNDFYKADFQYGCKDKIMEKYCDPRCIFYKNKDKEVSYVSLETIEDNLREFSRTDFKDISFDLCSVLGIPGSSIVYPGEFVLIFGDTKLGKTALLQNIIIRAKLKTDVLSTEIMEELWYRRAVQIKLGLDKKSIINYFMRSNAPFWQELSYIKMITATTSIENLKEHILLNKPKIVLIDVVDGLNVYPLQQYRTAEEKLGHELKNLAKSTRTIILGVHHIPKSEARDKDGKSKRLTIHSGKGDSALEQKADKIIALEGIEDQNIRFVTLLGSRDEAKFEAEMWYDKDTFNFRPIHKKKKE